MAKENITTARRRTFVLDKRAAGYTFRQIAHAAIKHFGEENLPKGWDERYANKDCKRALSKLEEMGRERAKKVLELELRRLNALQAGLWGKALKGDTEAVNAILRIMRHRLRLLPLGGVAEKSILAPQNTSVVERISNEIRRVRKETDFEKYDREMLNGH